MEKQLIEPSAHHVELKFPAHVNRTTIFGILLGYPVVYWYDTRDETMSNCLGMTPLCVNKVNCLITLPDGDCHSNELFSYSFPLSMKHLVEKHIKVWYDNVLSIVSEIAVCSDCTMDTCTLVMPTVAM